MTPKVLNMDDKSSQKINWRAHKGGCVSPNFWSSLFFAQVSGLGLWFTVSKLVMTRTRENNKLTVTKLEYRLSRYSRPIGSKIGFPTFLNFATHKKYKQRSKIFAWSSQKLGRSGMVFPVMCWILSSRCVRVAIYLILHSNLGISVDLGYKFGIWVVFARLGLAGQHAGWLLIFRGSPSCSVAIWACNFSYSSSYFFVDQVEVIKQTWT